jgi:hypothetical protein
MCQGMFLLIWVFFDKTFSNGFVFCCLPSEKYSVLICISRN